MNRLKYFIKKIVVAHRKNVLGKKLRLFIANKIQQYIVIPFIYFFKIKGKLNKLGLDDRSGFKDHRGEVDFKSISDRNILRIIKAYKLAKEHQKNVTSELEIKGLWGEWILINYSDLIGALDRENIDQLRHIFDDIMRNPCAVGLGSFDEWNRSKRLFGKSYIKYVWYDYFTKLSKINPEYKITFPLVGNPSGLSLTNIVVPYESLRHSYRAEEIKNCLLDCDPKIIVEIGGGYGGLAFQLDTILGDANFHYSFYDIPEVAALASSFLLTSLSEDKIRLYGEEPSSLNVNSQVCVYPHFAIADLEAQSVDLFYNSCSFSEMDGQSAKYYLKVIQKAGRKYFMHDNHDTKFRFKEADGLYSENVIGSDLIPNTNSFKLIYKKPRTHGLPEDRSFVHHEYLYEKMRVI